MILPLVVAAGTQFEIPVPIAKLRIVAGARGAQLQIANGQVFALSSTALYEARAGEQFRKVKLIAAAADLVVEYVTDPDEPLDRPNPEPPKSGAVTLGEFNPLADVSAGLHYVSATPIDVSAFRLVAAILDGQAAGFTGGTSPKITMALRTYYDGAAALSSYVRSITTNGQSLPGVSMISFGNAANDTSNLLAQSIVGGETWVSLAYTVSGLPTAITGTCRMKLIGVY